MAISRETYDPTKKYRRIRFHEDRQLLDSELNELQSITEQARRELTDQLFTDGALLEGGAATIQVGSPHVLQIEAGQVYLAGLAQPFDAATLAFDPAKVTGNDEVYAELLKLSVDLALDESLANPRTGEPTAEREQWAVSLRAGDPSTEPLPAGATSRVVARTHIFDRAAGTVRAAVSRSAFVLDHLADAVISGAQNGQILRYDGATEQWKNSNERTDADTVDGFHAAVAATANKLLPLDGSAQLPASITGNSATATKLQTARTINGVSFDGSANITVTANPNAHTHPGTDVTSAVASATNADTVDNIHAATTAQANKLLALDAASKLPASITGNAATATALQTARTINGVNFDGTANITVTAAPNAHTHAGTDVTSAVANATLAASATKLATARNINGVAFDGTANITVTANPNAHTHPGTDVTSVVAQATNATTVGGYAPSTTPGAGAIPVTNANGRLAGTLIEGTRPGATIIVAASTSRNKNQADYVCTGTNDGTILQSAIDAAYALGGGTVQLLEGTFNIGSLQQIDMKSNVHLRGMGKGSTLLSDVGAPTIQLNAAGAGDVIRNVKISDMELTTPAAAAYGSVAMIGAGRVEDVWIDNLKITNTCINSTAVYHNCTGGSRRVKVTNCESYTPASGAYGILFWGKVDGLWIEDNYVEIINTAGYNPIGIYGDCIHFSCCRNVVVTAGHTGIASSQSSYGVISGNIIDTTVVTSPEVEAGIEVEWKYAHGGTDTSHHVIVSDNIIYNGNIGILVTRRDTNTGYTNPYAVLIEGNILEDCATGISLVYGDDVSVHGNIFRNCPIEVAWERNNVTLDDFKVLGDLDLASTNRVVKTIRKVGLADNVATSVFKIHTTDRPWANGVLSCRIRGLVMSANTLNAINNAAKYGEWAFVKASSNDGSVSTVSPVTQIALTGSTSVNAAELDVGAVTVTLTNSGRDTTVKFQVDLNPNIYTKTVELVLTIEIDYFMYQDPPTITLL